VCSAKKPGLWRSQFSASSSKMTDRDLTAPSEFQHAFNKESRRSQLAGLRPSGEGLGGLRRLGATGRVWCNLRESCAALARKAIRCGRAVERRPGARPGLGKSKVSGAPSLPRRSTRQAQFRLSAECFAPVGREAVARLKVRSGATICESLPQCPLRFAPGTIGRNLRPRVGPGSSLIVSHKEVAKLKGSPADAGRCCALEFRHFLRVASCKKTGPYILKSWSKGPGASPV